MKGERRGKEKTKFSSFDHAEPNPILSKDSERRAQRQGEKMNHKSQREGGRREKGKQAKAHEHGKPHLSGREGGSRERKEGEDCVSAASSAAPSEASAPERKSPIPGGGSSWFVLLTEEKNEQKSPSWIPHHAGNDRIGE